MGVWGRVISGLPTFVTAVCLSRARVRNTVYIRGGRGRERTIDEAKATFLHASAGVSSPTVLLPKSPAAGAPRLNGSSGGGGQLPQDPKVELEPC